MSDQKSELIADLGRWIEACRETFLGVAEAAGTEEAFDWLVREANLKRRQFVGTPNLYPTTGLALFSGTRSRKPPATPYERSAP